MLKIVLTIPLFGTPVFYSLLPLWRGVIGQDSYSGSTPHHTATYQIFFSGIGHLLSCSQSSEITANLLACLTSQIEGLTPQDLTLLRMRTSESWELPAAWLLSSCLMFIWEQRAAGKMASLELCRAELRANLNILKSTKWRHYTLHNSALLLDEALNLHFL